MIEQNNMLPLLIEVDQFFYPEGGL